jgi:hypothetical protein
MEVMPHLVPVTSSNVAAIGYESGSSTLYVRFHHGGTYAYSGVSASVHAAFMSAGSKGQYLAYQIKGTYPYVRIG